MSSPAEPDYGRTPDAETILMRAAERQVERMSKSLLSRSRRERIMLWTVSVLVVILSVLSVLTITAHFDEVTLSNRIRQGGISQCEANNAFRRADLVKWENFVGLVTVTPQDAIERARDEKVITGLLDANATSSVQRQDAAAFAHQVFFADSSPELKAEGALFLKYIAVTDAPRNCLKVYGKS